MKKLLKNIATPLMASAIIVAGLAGAAATDAIPNPLPNAVAGNVIKATDINDLATAVGILDERTVNAVNHDTNGDVITSGNIVTSKTIKQKQSERIHLGGRNTTWLLTSYEKGYTNYSNAESFSITISNASSYGGVSPKTILIDQDGNIDLGLHTGNASALYPVNIRTYEADGNVYVYLIANNYDDNYTLDVNYNSVDTSIIPSIVGDNTFIPNGNLLEDSASASFNINTGDEARITVLGTGEVGIGTVTPDSKLSVVGLPSAANDSATIGALQGAVCITDAGNMYIDTDGTCSN